MLSFVWRFLERNSLGAFFVFLQLVSVVLIFSRNSMQRSFVAANVSAFNAFVSGYIDEGASYFRLKQVNEDLTAQNKMLMQQLYGKKKTTEAKFVHVDNTFTEGQSYSVMDAEIIQNSINRNNNYFTINRGRNQGVEPQMGVIAPQGIAGIVVNTTANYALVQSVLSVNNIKINTSLKKSDFFGTLTWDGEDTRVMHLKDIPKYVSVKVGDTVITDGKSSIFPKGIMIGRVAGYDVDSKTGHWDISVELSQNMGQVQKVFVVKNLKKVELEEIKEILDAAVKEND